MSDTRFHVPRRASLLGVLLLAILSLGACGGDDGGAGDGGESEAARGGPAPTAAPAAATKDGLIALLRSAWTAIDGKDWKGASTHFHFGPGAPKESELEDAFTSLVSKREISSDGIDILEAKGRFGPLAEIFPERGAAWAERAGLPLARCYGLGLEDAEVAVYQGDEGLKILRLDDVGKLR